MLRLSGCGNKSSVVHRHETAVFLQPHNACPHHFPASEADERAAAATISTRIAEGIGTIHASECSSCCGFTFLQNTLFGDRARFLDEVPYSPKRGTCRSDGIGGPARAVSLNGQEWRRVSFAQERGGAYKELSRVPRSAQLGA
jgi:hypothetical protein